MSMTRSLTKTAAIAAASLVAGAAPSAVLAGPVSAHPQHRLAASSTQRQQRAAQHHRSARRNKIPKGAPQP